VEQTRVILAEDHVAVRTGIKHLLNKASDIKVIGEAENGIEALKLVAELCPDVLLLDLEMPLMDGVEVTQRLHDQRSPVRILVLSIYGDRQIIREMLAHGAAGYLMKEDAPDSVIEAVRGVSRGETSWVSPPVARRSAAWKH
jgi:DNA-binding NarL/FixJ family response regulator